MRAASSTALSLASWEAAQREERQEEGLSNWKQVKLSKSDAEKLKDAAKQGNALCPKKLVRDCWFGRKIL